MPRIMDATLNVVSCRTVLIVVSIAAIASAVMTGLQAGQGASWPWWLLLTLLLAVLWSYTWFYCGREAVTGRHELGQTRQVSSPGGAAAGAADAAGNAAARAKIPDHDIAQTAGSTVGAVAPRASGHWSKAETARSEATPRRAHGVDGDGGNGNDTTTQTTDDARVTPVSFVASSPAASTDSPAAAVVESGTWQPADHTSEDETGADQPTARADAMTDAKFDETHVRQPTDHQGASHGGTAESQDSAGTTSSSVSKAAGTATASANSEGSPGESAERKDFTKQSNDRRAVVDSEATASSDRTDADTVSDAGDADQTGADQTGTDQAGADQTGGGGDVSRAGSRKDHEASTSSAKTDESRQSKPATLDAPRGGKPDDLKQISGVGPKLEGLLHSLGVYHFDQIAGWSQADVAWVDDHLGFKGRIERDDWIGQSRSLASGETTDFAEDVSRGPVDSSKKS
ncbi:MAG: hypothetical protein AAFZ01_10670 [Pseudomonadota bacterium]